MSCGEFLVSPAIRMQIPTNPTDDHPCYRDANVVSDSEHSTEEHKGEDEFPAPVLFNGAGDDPYAAYDPGMAGCATEPIACHIPGILWIGTGTTGAETLPDPGFSSSSHAPRDGHGHQTQWVSHGYERDAEEYEDEDKGKDKAERETKTGEYPISASGPDSGTDSGVDERTRQNSKPPMGTRIVGPSFSRSLVVTHSDS